MYGGLQLVKTYATIYIVNENIKTPQSETLPLAAGADGEILNPNAMVPVSYEPESGENVSGDFAFVGKVWGYDEIKKGEGILIDHPEVATDFLERGVASLDDHIPESEDLVIHVLNTDITNDPAYQTNISQTGSVRTLTLHPNRTFTITKDRKVTVEPFTASPLEAHIEANSSAVLSNFNRQFGEVLETPLTSYDYSEVFERDPVLQERLESIGLVSRMEVGNQSNQRDSMTFPTVQRLRDEFARLSEDDTDSGVYYPRLRLVAGGQFDGTTFIDAYADLDENGFGEYIMAADELNYFGHDLAAEHLVTLMACGSGRPMMQAMSRFAAVVKTSEHLDLPNGGYSGRTATLSGSDKNDRAAVIIDRFTQELNKVIHDTDHPDERQKHYEGRNINGFVKTLREAGQLEDLEVVQFMLNTGAVENAEQITELLLLQALDSMARSQLQSTELQVIAA